MCILTFQQEEQFMYMKWTGFFPSLTSYPWIDHTLVFYTGTQQGLSQLPQLWGNLSSNYHAPIMNDD